MTKGPTKLISRIGPDFDVEDTPAWRRMLRNHERAKRQAARLGRDPKPPNRDRVLVLELAEDS